MRSFAILILIVGSALGDSTVSTSQRFAYAANGGWLNWKWDTTTPDGAVVSESLLSGFVYSSNFGWINLGDGDPANGHSYAQTGGEFGVNHDGAGNLTGYAYGANIGWINFDWAAGVDPNEPRINLSNGEFSGYAYGTNVGWIDLGATATTLLVTETVTCPDSDSDGIADWWERFHAGNLTTYTAISDSDGDGSSDVAEYEADTDPDDAASVFSSTSAYTAGSTTFSITFASSPRRLYEIETSTALSGWADSGLGTFVPSAGTSTTKAVTILGSGVEPRRFFRVRAKKPLQP